LNFIGFSSRDVKYNPLILMIFLTGFFLISSTSVLAEHTATVTINPDIANCDQLGNTFTVTVKNKDTSQDSIWTVDIYKSTGVSIFSCGSPPSGWKLANYSQTIGLCRYTSTLGNYIDPGEQLDFTFYAVMTSSIDCDRQFHVATLDNHTDMGEYWHSYPVVKVDCTKPDIFKILGEPKIAGDGFDWWISQDTDIEVYAHDNKTTDTCNLGLDWCKISYTVDGGPVQTEKFWDGDDYDWYYKFNFGEDSVHILNITCVDIAGNNKTILETDRVDTTPPETEKTYGNPHHPSDINNGAPYPHYISTSTPITLAADDPEAPTTPQGVDCSIGVEKTWYLDTIVDDSYCMSEQDCQAVCPSPYDVNYDCTDESCAEWAQQECEDYQNLGYNYWEDCVEDKVNSCVNCGVGEWKLYRGEPIYKDQESCHVIQFLSADYLGNDEDMNVQCVFVDDTPPRGTKTVGEPSYYENSNTETDNLCYKDAQKDWQCYTTLPSTLENIGYNQLPQGTVTYEDYGPFLKINVQLSGLKPNTAYQLTLNGRNGGDGNDELANNCEFPNAPARGYQYAWECGYWSGVTGQEGFWNFDMKAMTDGSGNYEKTYFLHMPDGHYGIPSDNDPSYGIGFIVKEAADVPGGSNYPPILMETHGLDWTIDKSQPVWVRDHVTPITLDCTDQLPHPVGGEEVCFRVSFDGETPWLTQSYCSLVGGQMQGPNMDDWCCVPSPTTIIFQEDSLHDLEYYCRDALKNKNNVDTEYFKVDSQPPVITKTVSGKYYGNCNPIVDDQCWLKDWNENGDGATIHVEAQDDNTHRCVVDQVKCQWWYYVDDNGPYYTDQGYPTQGKSPWLTPPFDIKFYDETHHELHINCTDALGNWNEDIETFYVDSSPPQTSKTYGDPHYPADINSGDPYPHYITSSTPITLSSTDYPNDCAVDVDKTYYNVTLVDDIYCQYEYECQQLTPPTPNDPLNPGSDWNKYTNPFQIHDESCHAIFYYSLDKLGNVESVKRQCVFVDNTPPTSGKKIDNPNVRKNGDAYVYITKNTPINLYCDDSSPHPSGAASLYYRYRVSDNCQDWGDWTGWIGTQEGTMLLTAAVLIDFQHLGCIQHSQLTSPKNQNTNYT